MRNWLWVQECGKSGPGARAEGEGRGPSMGLACEGSEVGWAWLRCPWAAEGPGRASSRHVELPNSDPAPLVWRAPEGPEGLVAVPVGGGRARAGLEIDHSEPQARVWRSRGRAAAHRHTQRPGPSRQASGARNTSGATSINTRRRRLAGGPPPTGTQSDQTELGRSCAVDGGWAAAHGRSEQPGLTQHAAPGTPAALHRKQSRSNTTKNARPATIVHSFTATLPKVI